METLLAHCGMAFTGYGSHLLVFFLAGLAGSLTHCLIMCGPVVACQAACGGQCGARSSQFTQWQYHLGRLATYGGLGFVAALLSRQVATYSFWPKLAGMMLVLAGAMFLVSSLFGSHPLHRRLANTSGFLRGTLMGFMPCGLLYAALMAAATFAEPLKGMVAMWLFVLGTMPALLLSSSGAALLARHWQHIADRTGRALMAFNGLSLIVMAAGFMR